MEFIQAAFSGPNLLFTIFLLLMFLYWIMVIFGALDLGFLNVDADADADIDLDADADADMHLDLEGDADIGDGGFLDGFLAFFYIGTIPFMVLLSVLALCMWSISILANWYLNPGGSVIVGFPIALGNVIVSVLICKVICFPLARFFAMFRKDYNAPRAVLGRIGRVITTEISTGRMGQVEVSTDGAPIVLNAVTDGSHVFHKGDEVVIVKKEETKGVYTVAPVNLEE
ncbi:MAG: DUF1449 family protein [Sedimentisphaerales bacterium]|nr:DUF1449 family protein [Sedimentisphaerales bacterium]